MAFLIPTFLLVFFSLFNLLGINQHYFISQLINFGVGLVLFFVVRKIGTQFFRQNSGLFYWLFLGILIITFIIGIEAKGSRRWIDLFFFNFQASEFFKIFFLIFIANFFVENRKRIYSASQFFLSIGYFILPTFIIFEQPDLGSALVYGFMFLVMLLFSPFPKKYLIYIAVIAGMLVPFGWMMMKDYQRERIVSFIQPHTKQQGTAYNMTQAIIAVGSGEFVGKGLGSGTQSQLSFLPEDHTDFAFSSLVEQFGFIGGMGVIGLYIVLSLMFIKRLVTYYGKRDEDGYFSFLYTLGFFSFMIFQTFVNIGMNMGVLPIAGITLPLISYGGSSLLTWMLGLALLP